MVKWWDLDTQHCFKTMVGHRTEVYVGSWAQGKNSKAERKRWFLPWPFHDFVFTANSNQHVLSLEREVGVVDKVPTVRADAAALAFSRNWPRISF